MKVTVIGRVSQVPEEKESKKAKNYYCKCSIAESDKEGKNTVFYNVIAFDEHVGGTMMLMPKGKLVKIQGDFECDGRVSKTVKDEVIITRTIKVYDADHIEMYDNKDKKFVSAELYEES